MLANLATVEALSLGWYAYSSTAYKGGGGGTLGRLGNSRRL